MQKFLKNAFIVALLMGLAACSSSGTHEDGELDDAPAADVDAGTDAVPQPSAENPGSTPEVAGAQADAPPPPDALPSGDPAAAPPPPEATATTADASTPPPDTAPAPTPSDPSAPAPAPTMAEAAPSVPAAPAVTESSSSSSSAASSGGGGTTEYTVQSGDTLMKIAFETYGDLYQWKKIYEMNRDQMKDPNTITTGMKLKVEQPSTQTAIDRNGEKYLVKNGDTLGTISAEVYGTKRKWKKIWNNNKQLVKNPNQIFAGFYLYYTMTPEDREELERLRKEAPAPLAESQPPAQEAAASPDGPRGPASVSGAAAEQPPVQVGQPQAAAPPAGMPGMKPGQPPAQGAPQAQAVPQVQPGQPQAPATN